MKMIQIIDLNKKIIFKIDMNNLNMIMKMNLSIINKELEKKSKFY